MTAARRVRFRQADMARALRAATSAGLKVARSEIDADGKLTLIYAEVGPASSQSEGERALEEWEAKNARRS